MTGMYRTVATSGLALAGALTIGIAPLALPGAALAENRTVLVMGGTGTPDPDAEPGYVDNIMDYYVDTNPLCKPPTDTCTPLAVVTPETAWPLYGGLSALTWQQSILQGVELYDDEVNEQLDADPNAKLVLFGYSQSGAILSIEKRRLADDPDVNKDNIAIVVIGNVSRPNGGLNGRLPFTIPIVQFPYGPTMPVDTGIETTDIALKWDIIADAPLYVLNPLAMFNALLGGPGFGIIHGTYPNPEGDPLPTDPDAPGPGGYTRGEWQEIMDDPAAYEATHPGTVDIEKVGDTTYITVTPKILPLVQPLHALGLKPVADLIEPALRVIIEETGYDRDLSYGTPTTFRLIPVFNPVTLAVQLVPAIEQGVEQFVDDIAGDSATTSVPFEARLTDETPQIEAEVETPAVTPLVADLPDVPEETPQPVAETSVETVATDDAQDGTGTQDQTESPRHTFRPFKALRDRLIERLTGTRGDDESETADDTDQGSAGDEDQDQDDDDAASEDQDADAA